MMEPMQIIDLVKIPEIKKFDFFVDQNKWEFNVYSEFENRFIENNTLDEEVQEYLYQYISKPTKNFRKQSILKSIPVLIGFFYDQKQICIYTQRLGRELFLLNETEKIDPNNKNQKYLEFKSYVNKVSTLDITTFPSVIERVTSKYNLLDLINNPLNDVEGRSLKLKNELIKYVNEYKPSYFEKISDFALGLTANYALLRIHLLKFLAILPSLDYDQKGTEVKRILMESFRLSLIHI